MEGNLTSHLIELNCAWVYSASYATMTIHIFSLSNMANIYIAMSICISHAIFWGEGGVYFSTLNSSFGLIFSIKL